MSESEEVFDKWAEWLLRRRHGGNPLELQRVLDFLVPVRDRLLSNAQVATGDVVLDVGTGDGLIAFGALERIGEQGRVIFSDISEDLLRRSRELARQLHVENRCHFVCASATDLVSVGDASVDVVTTRSVLIYVENKQRAFHEFFRVLRPGGRISLFEPINRFRIGKPIYDMEPIRGLADKVRAVYEDLQPSDSDPMLNFDERDLLAFAEQSGFREIHLELQTEIKESKPGDWETALHSSGNPLVPTLEEVIREVLTPAEIQQYEAYLRPRIETGQGIERNAVAYLWAFKH